MKNLLHIGLLYLSLTIAASCNNKAPGKPADVNMIALQPIGPFTQLTYVQTQISAFFHKPVFILPGIQMPKTALDTSKSERYSADTILRHLPALTGDHIPIIVALTEKDIFTTVREKNGAIKQPSSKYAIWGIFGLGDCPGPASVISDFRLHTSDTSLYHHRLRTVALHELGHNLGLPHCTNPHCIMNDANEKIATIDNSARDYCRDCRDRLGMP